MKKINLMKLLCFILTIYTLLVPLCLPISADEGLRAAQTECPEIAEPTLAEGVEVGSRFWELFFGKKERVDEEISLVPGGGVFGVRLKQKYVTVTESTLIPMLKAGDIILSVDGVEVGCAEEIKQIVRSSGGNSITIRALHRGNEIALEVRPGLVDGEYSLGLSLRDGAAGLGTVTFIDPKSGIFGGLGHGVCDGDSGEVIAMERGEVCGVILGGIHKGESGKPGELCGILTDKRLGSLSDNTECGVFGQLAEGYDPSAEAIPVGLRDEISEGAAVIRSTLKNGMTADYKIEIYDIDRDSTGSKSFRIRVTDTTLTALTGGIVRGMSGSPIIQNGKLVGAVTHVLVADPTEGYGIFIENMLTKSGLLPSQKAA